MLKVQQNKNSISTNQQTPFNLHTYQLKNGLKLFMSINKNEPRIFTNIVFRAGSKHDPEDTTGLAHYMEHMLFKGTSKIGSLDWDKEKVLLKKISDLYEKYRQTKDETERNKIYKEIDQVSFEAAKLVAPSEYDRLVGALGADKTNAYTWVEQTVYVNDIPCNELDRWMELEAERFSMLSLRLFHTELETVYEEFNIGQDKDFRKVNKMMCEKLFPKHPYGTHTTIGKPEHLRNPSMANIQDFFKKYYVSNNMAIVISGDFDPKEAIELANKHFGHYQPSEIPPFHFENQPEIKAPIKVDVLGKESPYVEIAWRMGGSSTDDQLYLSIIANLLFNQQAGLLDINVNQEQLALETEAWSRFHEDYSMMGLYGVPKEGQSLEEVEKLLLEQIQNLKNGNFEEWLVKAVLRDMELSETRAYEHNSHRVSLLSNLFITNVTWERYLSKYEFGKQLSKTAIVDYVKKHFKDNYCTIYKRQGEDPTVIKVEKPDITHIELQRDAFSDFGKKFLNKKVPPLQPSFVDYQKSIHTESIKNGLRFDYVENKNNQLFRVDFIFEMGKLNDPLLCIALDYFMYLGTPKYTASDLKKEFFKLGISFDTNCYNNRSYISLVGLNESLEKGLDLLNHVLQHAQPNQAALDNVVSDILVRRENDQKSREHILRRALINYVKYGQDSPFSFRLAADELKSINVQSLTEMVKGLMDYDHHLYYYGPSDQKQIKDLLENKIIEQDIKKPVIPTHSFVQKETQKKVFFLDFPIVQTDILLLSKGTPHFNLEEYTMADLYNEYFGYGLSSIVFQEIRESKALAYSTYAFFSSPVKAKEAHYLSAYVGTQPDKISDAIPALLSIINDMPVVENQIQQTRDNILKKIESDRVLPAEIFWGYLATKDKGYDRDLSKDIYTKMKNTRAQDLVDFQKQYIKDRNFSFLVLGDKKRIDLEYLKQFGELVELKMEDVFCY